MDDIAGGCDEEGIMRCSFKRCKLRSTGQCLGCGEAFRDRANGHACTRCGRKFCSAKCAADFQGACECDGQAGHEFPPLPPPPPTPCADAEAGDGGSGRSGGPIPAHSIADLLKAAVTLPARATIRHQPRPRRMRSARILQQLLDNHARCHEQMRKHCNSDTIQAERRRARGLGLAPHSL